MVSLPIAFLSLVPSGTVGAGVFDADPRSSGRCSRSTPRSTRCRARSTRPGRRSACRCFTWRRSRSPTAPSPASRCGGSPSASGPPGVGAARDRVTGVGGTREHASPEDLPPLELRELRDLEVSAARTAANALAYIESASAVVRRGDFVYVIGDDEHDLGVFTISSERAGRDAPRPARRRRSRRRGRGRSPARQARPRGALVLPPFEARPTARCSGSARARTTQGTRDRGFFWRLAADGSLEGEPEVIDLHPLYEKLRGEIEELNIEGAAVLGDRFWLFHRGNEEARTWWSSSRSARRWARCAATTRSSATRCGRVRDYELGELGGTRAVLQRRHPALGRADRLHRLGRGRGRRDPRLGRRDDRRHGGSTGCARSTAAGRSRASTPPSTPG